MEHVKDCCKPINMTEFAKSVCGLMPSKEKAAQDAHMTPYESLAWTTALAIVRERMAAAQKHAADMSVFPVNHDSRAYAEGRYHALRDCLDEMEERGKP